VFLLAPLAGAAAVYILYDLLRFGGGAITGVAKLIPSGLVLTSPAIGFYGLSLSPGKGIFWFAPPLIAAVIAYPRFSERHPALANAFGTFIGLWLLTYCVLGSGAGAWDGGWGWGPRYLLPALPIALVPLAEWWSIPRARLAVLGLAAIGTVIQIPGATVDFMAAGTRAFTTYVRTCGGCNLNDAQHWRDLVPAGSDLVTETSMFLSGQLDLAWLTFRGTWLLPVTLLVAICLGAAGVMLVWKPLKETAAYESG
jgi:hypothetical protein